MQNILLAKEGIRFVYNSFKRKFIGYRKYDGNAEEICNQIVKNCWNGQFFKTGAGNFNQFWSRDFGMCCESLIKLGYKNEVRKSLNYALGIFSKQRKITTQITPDGKALNFPCYTPESIAYMVRNLRLLNDKVLIQKYITFIENEVNKAYKLSFDQDKGIIKKNKHFSEMRDHYIKKSSMYTNSMLFMLSNELNKLKLLNPFKGYNFKKIQKDFFWTGDYFLDDLSGNVHVAGDANTFPFWTQNFTSKKMFKSCLNKIQENNLDKPWPLKYVQKDQKKKEMFLPEVFAPNYEGNTIWMHLGACFIKTIDMFDKNQAKKYLNQYKETIELNKNYMEVFNPDGTLYKTLFYTADESMLWSSIFLELSSNA
tara:strand:+ start:3230 stop:4333 length:1104 start_codon:yes stop_codon:yes gene_type:complete